MKHTIKSIPESERPYEKCLRFGAEHLTDSELLAIILRTGFQGENSLNLARSVLERCSYQKGLLGLTHMTVSELMEIKGIGKVKAIQIRCLAELARRMARQKLWRGWIFLLRIRSPVTIWKICGIGRKK